YLHYLILPPTRSTLFPYTTLFRSHVTESGIHRNQLFYFRHDVWKAMSEPALTSLKLDMFEECSAPEIQGAMERYILRTCQALERSEEHTSELQSQSNLVCRLLLEK